MDAALKQKRTGATIAGSLTTRDRLKAAARKLFAERGIEGTTVRDILTLAGEKNGASLNYYFGSKDALIRELTVDVFSMMDERWTSRIMALDAEGRHSIRDYVRLLVMASDTSDVEEEPTTARLSEALSHHRYHLVRDVLKEHKLSAYDQVLSRIASELPDMPRPSVRHRLLLLTSYLTSVFALYEAARTANVKPRVVSLPQGADLGILVDTAVGLLTAELVDTDRLA
jgi:AcrR family transcriptional regulator